MTDAIHIVLDLETFGTGPHAAIASVGASSFRLGRNEPPRNFYHSVAIDDFWSDKFEFDPKTIRWWLRQSEVARGALSWAAMGLTEVLLAFNAWVKAQYSSPGKDASDIRMWGNGSAFDNVILRHAYSVSGLDAPWDFRQDRDLRTILELYPKADQGVFEGTKHHALDDAMHEAMTLRQALELHYGVTK